MNALSGTPEWAARDFHTNALAAVEAVLAFNRAAPVESRFDGLHFDVEPYLLVGYADPLFRKEILTEYLELVAKVLEKVKAEPEFRFGCDVPAWFYPSSAAERAAMTVSFRGAEKPVGECVFYGEGGTFAINNSAWTIYDQKGTKTGEGKGPGGGDAAHIGNFLETIRGREKLNSPIEEGQKSTMLCHLGNIAYRTNTVVRVDPKTGKMIDNPAGEKLWKREYRKEFEPTI